MGRGAPHGKAAYRRGDIQSRQGSDGPAHMMPFLFLCMICAYLEVILVHVLVNSEAYIYSCGAQADQRDSTIWVCVIQQLLSLSI